MLKERAYKELQKLTSTLHIVITTIHTLRYFLIIGIIICVETPEPEAQEAKANFIYIFSTVILLFERKRALLQLRQQLYGSYFYLRTNDLTGSLDTKQLPPGASVRWDTFTFSAEVLLPSEYLAISFPALQDYRRDLSTREKKTPDRSFLLACVISENTEQKFKSSFVLCEIDTVSISARGTKREAQ